jgi:hypothetical protein
MLIIFGRGQKPAIEHIQRTHTCLVPRLFGAVLRCQLPLSRETRV